MEIIDKAKRSTTLGIVIFTGVFLLYNSILQQFLGKEVTYMHDLVIQAFKIFSWYVIGNKAINAVGNLKIGGKKWISH